MILVVGGTGDLGGRVVGRLIERGDDVRCLVRPESDHQRLQAAVGANNGTHKFSHKSVNTIESGRKKQNSSKATKMHFNGFCNNFLQCIFSYYISKKSICNYKR